MPSKSLVSKYVCPSFVIAGLVSLLAAPAAAEAPAASPRIRILAT